MKFISTRNPDFIVGAEEALLRSTPPDNGLFVPQAFPTPGTDFFEKISDGTLTEIAFELSKLLFSDEISSGKLATIIEKAFPFDTPAVALEEGKTHVLELFHGPSLAFKDVGARYMAGMMSYFLQKADKDVHILVATSGDTGGAVAMGFLNMPGVRVTILYPSGRVSELQERQLTTLGGNVTALEVEGSFDDCQAMVKAAFADPQLNERMRLASANSINIFRLIPQGFYYVRAYGQVKRYGKPVVFSVPSGNFGNLSAGVMMHKMGLPVQQFVASTNLNKVVPDYLKTRQYIPLESSIATISNAMDVGDPSNFVRLLRFFNDDYEALKTRVSGYFFDDQQTKQAMTDVYRQYEYVMCPHTAIGYLGLCAYQHTSDDTCGITLSTAHPSKFKDLVEEVIGASVEVPERLAVLVNRSRQSQLIPARFEALKEFLMPALV